MSFLLSRSTANNVSPAAVRVSEHVVLLEEQGCDTIFMASCMML